MKDFSKLAQYWGQDEWSEIELVGQAPPYIACRSGGRKEGSK
jgi:hypothetical protein